MSAVPCSLYASDLEPRDNCPIAQKGDQEGKHNQGDECSYFAYLIEHFWLLNDLSYRLFYFCSHIKKKNKQGIFTVNKLLMIHNLLIADSDHSVHSGRQIQIVSSHQR